MESRRQHVLGGNDVETFEAGKPRQQIEIRGPQTAAVCRLIRNVTMMWRYGGSSSAASSRSRSACSSMRPLDCTNASKRV